MKKIETEIGNIHIVDAPYWAGEHSFTHYANQCSNERNNYTDLWAVDIYRRSGLDPLKHYERHYIWADADEASAAREAMRFANNETKVLLTHIVPLNDRLREPATF